MSTKPVVLGIDEDRASQGLIAQTFNRHSITYRFITDRKKVAGALSQLNPHLIMVYGELSSDFVIQVLDGLAGDISHAALPVVVVCEDVSDAPFVLGMRSGVVALLPAPFDGSYVDVLQALWGELASRSGSASGQGSSAVLNRVVDHLRRTRRSGVLTTNPRAPNQGRASFVKGKLERASFQGLVSHDALKAITSQEHARWTFSEVAGRHGEGAGVVIEVGEITSSEREVADIVVGQEEPEDEPLAFEVPVGRPPSPPPQVAPIAAGTHHKLLLVDDDESILRMFSALFTKHGFLVTTAVDGQAGVELALQRDFDVVLADLNMPRLDGWGMLRVLREDFRTRELPVAFISAHDDYRESLRALDAGAQAYLSKGTRLDAIIGQVHKLLEPREHTLGELSSMHRPVPLGISAVGPQWLLRQLAHRKFEGTLTARDGWASYLLVFSKGACLHASAEAGKYRAEGERAFNAFVASRAAEGTLTPDGPPGTKQSLFLPTEVLIERACSTLNENESRMRDNLMVSATQIEVNEELYAVYAQVGPKQWLEAARLICEEKLPPRDVIARLDVSPLDVEETMKDLIRRGVVVLQRR